MAQIAASIEYEDAPPPGGLPDDMQAPPGVSLREGHIFTDNTEALTDAVAAWLGEQQL